MMTHDPFQTLSAWGQYPGVTGQLGLPYATQQGAGNPFGANPYANNPYANNPFATNPLATQGMLQNPGITQQGQQGQQGFGGIPGYGAIHPQQLQLAAILAAQAGIYGGLQNPLLASLYQNPLAQAGLHNPLLNPILAQQYGQQWTPQQLNPILAQQYGQQPQQLNPFQAQQYGQQPQQVNPFLAQQYGQQLQPQTWLGSPFGVHPLAQFGGGRGFGAQGMSPWAGY